MENKTEITFSYKDLRKIFDKFGLHFSIEVIPDEESLRAKKTERKWCLEPRWRQKAGNETIDIGNPDKVHRSRVFECKKVYLPTTWSEGNIENVEEGIKKICEKVGQALIKKGILIQTPSHTFVEYEFLEKPNEHENVPIRTIKLTKGELELYETKILREMK